MMMDMMSISVYLLKHKRCDLIKLLRVDVDVDDTEKHSVDHCGAPEQQTICAVMVVMISTV